MGSFPDFLFMEVEVNNGSRLNPTITLAIPVSRKSQFIPMPKQQNKNVAYGYLVGFTITCPLIFFYGYTHEA